jgi:hypothetical protein
MSRRGLDVSLEAIALGRHQASHLDVQRHFCRGPRGFEAISASLFLFRSKLAGISRISRSLSPRIQAQLSATCGRKACICNSDTHVLLVAKILFRYGSLESLCGNAGKERSRWFVGGKSWGRTIGKRGSREVLCKTSGRIVGIRVN